MYRQVDGTSMGSFLGPILAKSFVVFYEKLFFDRFHKPYINLRYVDYIFACFSSRNEASLFFYALNDLHRSLTFTTEGEKDNKLQFLDVLMDCFSSAFLTYIYIKKNLR